MVNTCTGLLTLSRSLKVCVFHTSEASLADSLSLPLRKASSQYLWKHSLQKSVGWAAVSPALLIGEKWKALLK